MKIASIVEGHGELQALPVLIRRIGQRLAPEASLEILRPIRIPRNRLLRAGELERAVDLAALQTGADDGILVLIDADKDCPRELGPALLRRATDHRPDRRIRVVLAKSEYESWFLAAAASLAGVRDLPEQLEAPEDPEEVRDAKGWLSDRLPRHRAYRETVDQPALSGRFALDSARSAPSFDKLWRDLESLLEGAR